MSVIMVLLISFMYTANLNTKKNMIGKADICRHPYSVRLDIPLISGEYPSGT